MAESASLASTVLSLLENSGWVWKGRSVPSLVSSIPDRLDAHVFSGLMAGIISTKYPLAIFRGKLNRFAELLVHMTRVLMNANVAETKTRLINMLKELSKGEIQYNFFIDTFESHTCTSAEEFLTGFRLSLGISEAHALGDLYSAANVEQFLPHQSAKTCTELYQAPIVFTIVALELVAEPVGKDTAELLEQRVSRRKHRPGILLPSDVRAVCTWMDNRAGLYQHMQSAAYNLQFLLSNLDLGDEHSHALSAVRHEIGLLMKYAQMSTGCKHGSSFCRYLSAKTSAISKYIVVQRKEGGSADVGYVDSIRESVYHMAESLMDHSLVETHLSEPAVRAIFDRLEFMFKIGLQGLTTNEYYTLVVSYARMLMYIVLILEDAVDEPRLSSAKDLLSALVKATMHFHPNPGPQAETRASMYKAWATEYLQVVRNVMAVFLKHPENKWALEVIEDTVPAIGEDKVVDLTSVSARIAGCYKQLLFPDMKLPIGTEQV